MSQLFLYRSLLIVIISMLGFSTLYAAPPGAAIGKVLWVKGVLKASQPQQTPRVLTRRSDIYESDTLITDASSTGEITFTDNSLLSLRENTTMVIAQYKYGKNVPKNKESYVEQLTKGGFRKISGAISHDHPDGFKSVTPVATIAVLGTEYSIYYTKEKGLAAKLEKGSISIQNGAGKITLKKCTQEETSKSNCKSSVYSRVTSATSVPVALTQQPPEFNNDVPIFPANSTACPFCTINSSGGTYTGTGIVSSFCVQ